MACIHIPEKIENIKAHMSNRLENFVRKNFINIHSIENIHIPYRGIPFFQKKCNIKTPWIFHGVM